MKKRLAFMALAVITASVMAIGLTGCAGSSQYAGTYKLSKNEQDGNITQGDALTQADAKLSPDKNYIEIKDSKNITFVLDGSDPINTTYAVEGSTLHINAGSQTLDFAVNGNDLSYTYTSGGKTAVMYFTKG